MIIANEIINEADKYPFPAEETVYEFSEPKVEKDMNGNNVTIAKVIDKRTLNALLQEKEEMENQLQIVNDKIASINNINNKNKSL